MKRVISIFICIVMIIGVLPTTAFATQTVELQTPTRFESYGAVVTLESLVDIEKLEKVLFEGFSDCSERIDIYSFGLRNTTANQNALMEYIWKEMPECFHVYGLGFYISGTRISAVAVSYSFTASEYKSMYAELVAAKDEMIVDIKDNENLNDVQKALLLHDRLALKCEYDYNLQNPDTMYLTYGALVDGVAVCEGYAHAYQYLLNEVGIENYYTSSVKLNHAWNIVYINNKPYHVDVTWDDSYIWFGPDRGVMGRVSHDNFLKSTAGLKATGHNATDFDTFPTDTTYDNYFWSNSYTAFQLVGDELYYIDNTAGKLKRYSDRQALCNVSSQWHDSTYDYGNNAMLSGNGHMLIYSLSDAVYTYNVSTNTSTLLYKPVLSLYCGIYGMKYTDDGYLVCDISTAAPNFDFKYELYQEKTAVTVPSHDYQRAFDSESHFDKCAGCESVINAKAHEFDGGCDSTCAGCDYVKIAEHSWSEYVYNDDATVQKDGTETRSCGICGESETRTAVGTRLPSTDPTYRPDEHMPFLTLNESENAVSLNQNKSWATRVYWGYIGEEHFEYKWFDDDLRHPAGTDYFADYTPREGEIYNFTKKGWYRFIVKAIRTGTSAEDYTYSELLFDFYYDGVSAPTVPTVTELGNNQVKINSNGTSIKKFYYGNIGQTNTPYSWFNDFWGVSLGTKTYQPVFDSRDGRIITLQTKGYYNIVIVTADNTEYVYTVYADSNAPIIKKQDGKAVVDIDILKGNVGTKATVSKLYYGYVGTEDKEINSYDQLKANSTGFSAVNATQGTAIALKNEGYYKFLAVVNLYNGKTVELMYTVANSF